MRVFFTVLSFFIVFKCSAGDSDRAIIHIQKAILKYPKVKRYTKDFRNRVMASIPLEKETVSVVGAAALSVLRGRVSTRKIKKISFEIYNFNVRPDVMYDFKSGTASGFVNLNMEF